jgi:hypothetical protein
MSQKVILMLIIRTMLQLLQRSSSERSIAAVLQISRNNFRNCDAAFKASPYSYKEFLATEDTPLSKIVNTRSRLMGLAYQTTAPARGPKATS